MKTICFTVAWPSIRFVDAFISLSQIAANKFLSGSLPELSQKRN